ncbi:MAG TPA: DUF5677 domain-containing protein [Tepidisphaeraceae bacterium]
MTISTEPSIDDAHPTEAEKRSWSECAQVATRLCGLLENAQRRDIVATVARYQQNRMIGAVNSLTVLRTQSPHHFGFDGAMILRGVYDIYLQALYIMHDPAQQVALATLFSEYACVEKKDLMDLLKGNCTEFSRSIVSSDPWMQGGEDVEEAFEHARANYQGRKQRTRRYWYEGDLRKLAKSVNYEAEYELMQRLLSAPVHSSPFALLSGPPMRRSGYLTISWRLTFRVLAKVMLLHGWEAEDETERLLLNSGAEPIFT